MKNLHRYTGQPRDRTCRQRTNKLELAFKIIGVLLLAAPINATAQRYSESAPASAQKTYFWIKREAVKSFIRYTTDEGHIKVFKNSVDVSTFLLGWVDSDYGFRLEGSTKDELYAVLAREIISLREIMTKTGYPKSVWSPDLVAVEEKYIRAISERAPTIEILRSCVLAQNPSFERLLEERLKVPSVENPQNMEDRQVQQIEVAIRDCAPDTSPLLTELSADLRRIFDRADSYRRNGHRSLPRFIFSEIGGTTPTTVEITWRPVSGSLRLITSFFYRLCEFRQADPSDPARCGYWTDVVDDQFTAAGDYKYFARWPDGRVRSGSISVVANSKVKRWVLSPQ